MIKNYFKTAFRNLLKGRMYSVINILGLATGMAIALLIGLWIWDELSYNKYHRNYDRLAQIMTTQTFNGETGTGPAVSIALGMELRNKYTDDFKKVSLATWNFGHILAVGDKKITKNGMWVQPEFPAMFGLKMVKGSIDGLKDPSSALLAESLAKALFGNTDPIGKTVKFDNKIDMKVAGVYEDLPRNTSLYETRLLIPWDKYITSESWLKEASTQWGNHSWQLFVQLNDKADIKKAASKIRDIARQHFKEGDERGVIHPMSNWRLYGKFTNGKTDGGRITFVWLFGIIGVFVLLLACINFMNLSTARSEKRAREVGIRKTMGSLRSQLIGQFLGESIIVAFVAFILSIGLALLSLSFFNGLADKEVSLPWSNPIFWLMALAFTVFTGIISGSYPAFYLSRFDPVKVLKGTFKAGRFSALPRKILVVVQFTVSIALIIGTIIVFRQIQYAKSRPVGYTREGLITVRINTDQLYGHYDALRGDLLATGVVENMGESNSPSTDIYSNQIGFEWKGKDPNAVPLFGIVAVTHDFGKTIGWQIREGRDFSRNYSTDTGQIILNEAGVKLTGFKDPVGQVIKWNDKDRMVIGVVKDMVMESPYVPAMPTVFYLDYGWTGVITIRIKPAIPIREAVSKLEPVFKQYNPGSPFEYEFTDEEYAKKFSDEERIGNLATFFAILAVFISCLGLFGLASFVAERRTKEIGVRKVLGASVMNIWQMLSKDFVSLVIISCIIAIPIAWYVLHQWLQQYEYRTPISWWIFTIAGLGAMAIALLTVSFQAVRAALSNPVKSLRSE
ncbi:FtsX-like permease family protein [Pseudoflavitalea sp. X16]|uniref:ABC transporter permease n=1 Tax=Paraflavitalea devenefica TaxID=2716334 RepID=UPI00141E73CE|nr:ABC transporter permease [Paraflavitalea devenefica]NII27997.1 FtsX-like permease family protein [Paraflavitalea devenefica]